MIVYFNISEKPGLAAFIWTELTSDALPVLGVRPFEPGYCKLRPAVSTVGCPWLKS